MKRLSFLLICCILFHKSDVCAFQNRDSSLNIPFVFVSYRLQLPGMDLSDRFGVNSAIGGGFDYKHKSGWILGVSGYFLFGKHVREDTILNSISTSNGYVIDQNGQFAIVDLQERGYCFALKIGKIIPLVKQHPGSGILVSGGVGFLEHKIRVVNIGNTAPQLSHEYKKGYDRLSNGSAISLTTGYLHLSRRRLINFFAGIEVTHAWTKNRRTLNYDSGQKDKILRNDSLYGLKVAWIIPLYNKQSEGFYYF